MGDFDPCDVSTYTEDVIQTVLDAWEANTGRNRTAHFVAYFDFKVLSCEQLPSQLHYTPYSALLAQQLGAR